MSEKKIFIFTLVAAIAFTLLTIFDLISKKNIPLTTSNAIISIVWWIVAFKNFKKTKMSS
ncbi:MAG: hypothetical protein ACRCTZ_08990 [Sarcina sp.]